MQFQNLLLFPAAITAAKAAVIPVSLGLLHQPDDSQQVQLVRRTDENGSGLVFQFREAAKQADGTYKQTQKASNVCFEYRMYVLLTINREAMDYQESLKLCTERHGVKPIASMDLQQKLQRAANEHAKGGPAGDPNFDHLPEVEKERLLEEDDAQAEKLYGTKPIRRPDGWPWDDDEEDGEEKYSFNSKISNTIINPQKKNNNNNRNNGIPAALSNVFRPFVQGVASSVERNNNNNNNNNNPPNLLMPARRRYTGFTIPPLLQVKPIL